MTGIAGIFKTLIAKRKQTMENKLKYSLMMWRLQTLKLKTEEVIVDKEVVLQNQSLAADSDRKPM